MFRNFSPLNYAYETYRKYEEQPLTFNKEKNL